MSMSILTQENQENISMVSMNLIMNRFMKELTFKEFRKGVDHESLFGWANPRFGY